MVRRGGPYEDIGYNGLAMPIDFQTFGSGVGRVNGFRVGLLGWPKWARTLLMVPMLPGILLLALSILLIGVSLLTLFVLTAPVYLCLAKLFNGKESVGQIASPGSKRVEAVVRDV